jgi:hypothetical protein
MRPRDPDSPRPTKADKKELEVKMSTVSGIRQGSKNEKDPEARPLQAIHENSEHHISKFREYLSELLAEGVRMILSEFDISEFGG